MKRICTICARGGSKGVKNKNIRSLLGKPLIAYSVIQACNSGLFDVVAVSSDSEAILEVAQAWGADILIKRPPELATDQAAKLPVIRHCVDEVEKLNNNRYDVIVDLDATSPLRSIDDIKGAVNLLEMEKAANVITGVNARRSPYFNLVEVDNDGSVNLAKSLPQRIVRRQDSPRCYDMNASVYVWTRQALFEKESVFGQGTRLYVMPEERSQDIDTELDFEIVELLLKKREIRPKSFHDAIHAK